MTLARVSLTLCLAFLHVPLYHPYITFGLHILYLETKKHVCLCSCCRSSGLIIFTADETLCQTCGFHSSPGFCLLSLLFLNDAIGGKKASFLEKYKSSLPVFFFPFLQIVLLVSYLRILCLTHGHKDFLLCFLLKVLHFLFRSV